MMTPEVILAVALGFTTLVTLVVGRLAERRQWELFERSTELAAKQVQYRVETYANLLRGGASFFAASDEVTGTELRIFVERLEVETFYPGIQGIGFSQRTPDPMRTLEEEEHRIVYLEPQDALNRAAMGFNMHSEPIRRAAMDAARDTGLPRLTGRVRLVQEQAATKPQDGFLIYVPVYRHEQKRPLSSVAERREKLLGFVYGAFRMGDFIKALEPNLKVSGLSVEVYDGPHAAPESRMEGARVEGAPRRGLSRTTQIGVAGRQWTLVFAGASVLGVAAPGVLTPALAVAGLLLSAFIYLAARQLSAARLAAEKSATEAAHSRRLFERIATATPDILYLYDLAENRAVYRNDSVQRILGIENDASQGAADWRQERVHPDDVAALHTYMQGLPGMQEGEIRTFEFRFRHARGDYRWLLTRCTAFARDDAGRVTQVLGLASDWTERREIEEALRGANHAKDHFLATLSHELRTPLTPVLTIVSSWREEGNLSPERREDLEVIQRSIELEARLIDDLLDLTRIVQGKMTLRPERIDLHALVTQCLRGVTEIDERNLDLITDCQADSPCVVGDPSRLTQVLWNILKNAAKFTPPGGRITVWTRNETLPTGEKGIRVAVEDSGIGIDSETLPKIFNAFEQGRSEITRQFGGLGLGLSISRSIVEAHGGSIRAESKGLGQGACFSFILPVAETRSALDRGGPRQPHDAGCRILLVEDHQDTADILARQLRRRGYDVVTACSVAEAQESAIGKDEFNLVVSDLGLPDGSGLDLMKDLSERFGWPGIAMSGFGADADLERSSGAGFSVHLVKPFSFDRLASAINEVLSEAGDACALRAHDVAGNGKHPRDP